ncbi:hypothetical protein DBV15_10025 [Temnothorax longispinosus]|uniref:Uncharacterized protein n=1 Tax=Temnothorax longispinosus TaxID=300112 RepID=A0A4S2KY30_9HYME|nr:hypothetical protein DBV15_10025 [Temnothorax longispinosus]
MASSTRDFTVGETRLYFQCGPRPRPMADLEVFGFECPPPLVKSHGGRFVARPTTIRYHLSKNNAAVFKTIDAAT